MNDHDWLATRYVLGELDSSDEATCEALLASDQAFRESVARSVELLAATRQGFQSEKARRVIYRPRRLTFLMAGMASGIAATILLAVGLMGVDGILPTLSRPTEVATIALPVEPPSKSEELDAENLEVVREWAHHQFEEESTPAIEEEIFVSPVMEELTQSEGENSSDWLNALAKLEPGT